MTYTTVTFAPVQSFIRASRKLRDLYGSSLLLSHLARALADDATARGHTVISPASVHSSRGVPNALVIEGDYRRSQASDALLACWRSVLESCRSWLEETLPKADSSLRFDWHSSWKACGSHTWELFHGQGASIEQARRALAVHKQQRDWSAPNWTGESSSLSSAEAVVWPGMGAVRDPRELPPGLIQQEARAFLERLRAHPGLGAAFAGVNEEISLTELVKRLITYPAVAGRALRTSTDQEPNIKELIPSRFQDLSMVARENEAEKSRRSESIVWFMADGDGIGEHLQSLGEGEGEKKGEKEALQSFSKAMRKWAAGLYDSVPKLMENQAMVVYAGGDDLFGALHETEPGANDLNTEHLWRWLKEFPAVWKGCDQNNLTVSMGLVWADAQVPQREALQHARDAEASAKARGKDRFALRLLYASGNHLEWTCPWQWLDPILSHYTDREGRSLRASRDGRPPSWRHLAEDLQWLHSRQAAEGSARTLWQAYFPGCKLPPATTSSTTGSLSRHAEPPFRASFEQPEKGRRFDQWLLDLGRVMAGLEKHRSRGNNASRRREEVAA